MNVTKLIEMLKAAGYDDSKAGAAAFEAVNLITFFEAYRKVIEDEAPGAATIKREIAALLADGIWPEYRSEDDRGLELDEYVEFFREVLTRLLLNRFAKSNRSVRLHGDDEDHGASRLLDKQS